MGLSGQVPFASSPAGYEAVFWAVLCPCRGWRRRRCGRGNPRSALCVSGGHPCCCWLYPRLPCLECLPAPNPVHLTSQPSSFKTQEDRQVSQEAFPPLLRGISTGGPSVLHSAPTRNVIRPWISAANIWGRDSVGNGGINR